MSLFGEVLGDCGCDGAGALDSALGDLVCIEGDCAEGAANVGELYTFYQKAGAPAKWSAAVGAITEQYNTENDKLSRQIPFSTVCCAIKAIGVQAKTLIAQIAKDTGVAPPPGIEAPSSTIETVVKGAVLVVGLVAVKSAIDALGAGRK